MMPKKKKVVATSPATVTARPPSASAASGEADAATERHTTSTSRPTADQLRLLDLERALLDSAQAWTEAADGSQAAVQVAAVLWTVVFAWLDGNSEELEALADYVGKSLKRMDAPVPLPLIRHRVRYDRIVYRIQAELEIANRRGKLAQTKMPKSIVNIAMVYMRFLHPELLTIGRTGAWKKHVMQQIEYKQLRPDPIVVKNVASWLVETMSDAVRTWVKDERERLLGLIPDKPEDRD